MKNVHSVSLDCTSDKTPEPELIFKGRKTSWCLREHCMLGVCVWL